MRNIKKDEEYLFSLGNFAIKLGLDNMREAMQKMEFPNLREKVIHVAGTNGKGSVLFCLEKLMISSGFSVCSTISPHLVSFNERFRHQGNPIGDEELNLIYNYALDGCGISDAVFPVHERWPLRLTFFELSIVMAFEFFRRKNPDFVLLETGMGGELDATNVCRSAAHLITSISIEHEEYLGKGICKIASAKAGIVKGNAPTFLAGQSFRESLETVSRRCAEKSSPMLYFPAEVETQRQGERLVYDIRGKRRLQLYPKRFALKGEHQCMNIGLALLAYHYLIPQNRWMDTDSIQSCLENISYPARNQYREGSPTILIDGAHNLDGIAKLIEHLNCRHGNQKILLALSWLQNKNVAEAFELQLKFKAEFYPVRMKYPMGSSLESMKQALIPLGHPVREGSDVSGLIDELEQEKFGAFDLIVICGSLYYIGELLRLASSSGKFSDLAHTLGIP